MDKDFEYYRKKVRRARQNYKALLAKPDFQKDVLAFRKKWRVPENGLNSDDAYKKWKRSVSKKKEAEYCTDVHEIMRTHKINPHHELTIRRYCLYNDPRPTFSMLNVVTIETGKSDNDNYFLKLLIGPDTRLDDVKKVWSFVEEEQEKLVSWKQKKFQPWRNFERDKYIYKLRERGKKLKEVAEEANKKYKPHVQYFEISKIIERYKKKLGIN